MTIISGQTIRKRKIIRESDFEDREKITDAYGTTTTRGLGPAGYDLSLDEMIEMPRGIALVDTFSLTWVIQPGAFTLASVREHIAMPADLIGTVHYKSSWARRGLTVQNTVIEPGWRGFLTLELKNIGSDPLFLTHGCGICQLLLHSLDAPAEQPYDGKYQDQSKGPQKAR